jgi:hypothetical protein
VVEAEPSAFQSYRAPAENGQAFVYPPSSRLRDAIAENHDRLSAAQLSFGGHDFLDVRARSRVDLLDCLSDERQSTNPSSPQTSAKGMFILGGHQPELYHAGVWFKNFYISALAENSNAHAVNLQIDHDLCRSVAIRVPVINAEGTLVQELIGPEPPSAAVPWEMRFAADKDNWSKFPALLNSKFAGSDRNLLAIRFWPHVLQKIAAGRPIGEAYSFARHQAELAEGLNTTDLPMSRLTRSSGFAFFCQALMRDSQRFAEIYNACRVVYRKEHRIRNAAHPVPALQSRGDWTEAALWIYHRDDPVRRAVFVRTHDGYWEVGDGVSPMVRLSMNSNDQFLADWNHFAEQGYCIRTRALTTTMFLRLFVADLFVHGIGGGKYDQLTDLIIKRWMGLNPPSYAVATATMRIPFAGKSQQVDGAEKLRQQLRDSFYHVETIRSSQLDVDSKLRDELERLTGHKRRLLMEIPQVGKRKLWHAEISRVNSELAQLATGYRTNLTDKLADTLVFERSQSILNSREYSIALFPPTLPRQLHELAKSQL